MPSLAARLRALFGGSRASTDLTTLSFEPRADAPPPAGVLALASSRGAEVDVYKTEYVGGKGANLLKLRRAGLPLPAFLVVPTTEADRLLQRARDKAGPGATRAQLADAILADELSVDVREMIRAFVGSSSETAYAVRSSANVEDGRDSSFAGQFETHLNVHGADHVAAAVKKCVASLLADSVQPYLERLGADAAKSASMAVVIMEQVDSAVAGVYFQANPVTGATSTHVLNAAPGQGEGVVSGTVDADEFWLNAADGTVRKRVIVDKVKSVRLAGPGEDGTAEVAVPDADKRKPALTDAQIAQLYAASKTVSRIYHSAQDMEWAFDAAGKLYVLQSRPITTRLEALTWDAPDEGLWRLNAHVSIPMSTIYSPIWERGWGEGVLWLSQNQTGAGFTKVDTANVNGFGYFCFRTLGPKKPPTAPPPAWFLRNLLRFAAKKDAATAQAFFRDKAYLKFVDEFKNKLKHEWIAKHRALQAEDVVGMSDAQLADYVKRCHQHLDEAYYAHVVYTLAVMLPCQWFVLWTTELTKCEAAEAYAALEGYSPVTEGIRGEFRAEVEAIAASPAALAILADAGTPAAERLAKLQAVEGAAGEGAKRIVTDVEHRLVEGYDPANAIVKENPSLLVAGIANAVEAIKDPRPPRGEAIGAKLRERVPEASRAEYDAMLDECRKISFLRDERALYTDLWASGILHRALVAAGDRLVSTNRLASDAKALVLEAGLDEIIAAVLDKDPVPAVRVDEWKRRNAHRFSASLRDAPVLIGGVDIDLTENHFPTKWMARAYITSIASARAIATPEDYEDKYAQLSGSLKDTLIGLSGSPGTYEGPVRVVKRAEDCATVVKGEVIVTESPSSLINLVLPFASAIVTDYGGALSHAAVCAREQGIPCVIGTRTGTVALKTGDVVRVDGSKGVVEIVKRA